MTYSHWYANQPIIMEFKAIGLDSFFHEGSDIIQ